MWQSTENIIKYIEDGVLQHKILKSCVRIVQIMLIQYDAIFLQLACLRKVEIGNG